LNFFNALRIKLKELSYQWVTNSHKRYLCLQKAVILNITIKFFPQGPMIPEFASPIDRMGPYSSASRLFIPLFPSWSAQRWADFLPAVCFTRFPFSPGALKPGFISYTTHRSLFCLGPCALCHAPFSYFSESLCVAFVCWNTYNSVNLWVRSVINGQSLRRVS